MTPSHALLASVVVHALALGAAATRIPISSARADWSGDESATFQLSITARPDPEEAVAGVAAPPVPNRETVPDLACEDSAFVPEPPPLREDWLAMPGAARATAEVPPPVPTASRIPYARVPAARDLQPSPTPPTEEAATRSQPPQDGASIEPSAIPGQNEPPRYPFVAWRRHIEGTVVVDLDLDTEGNVVALRLVTSSGCRALDQAALEKLVSWRFTPARGPLGPLRCTHRQSVVFRIHNRA